MKALFIGGTGIISMGIVRRLSEDPLWEVYLLNRGKRKDEGNRHAIGEVFQITGDEILTWDQIYRTIADALEVELKP